MVRVNDQQLSAMPTAPTGRLGTLPASRKRRRSSLECLTLDSATSDLPKRPRIFIVDDEEVLQSPAQLSRVSATIAEPIDTTSDVETSDISSLTSSSDQFIETSEVERSPCGERSSAKDDQDIAASEEDNTSSSSASSSSSSRSLDEQVCTATLIEGLTSPSRATNRYSISAQPLQTRLNSFLPKLSAANGRLEAARRAGLLKDHSIELEDQDPSNEAPVHIEMNLGLGVLEHMPQYSKYSSNESSSSSTSSTPGADDTDSAEKLQPLNRERQVLRRLLGQEKAEKPDIRVMGNGS